MSRLLRPFLAALVAALAVLAVTASPARADDTQPLCPPAFPICVITNWGQVEPDSIDASADGSAARLAGDPSTRVAVFVQSTSAIGPRTAADVPAPTVRTVISPTGFLPRETATLVAAIQRARFNRDGSIAKGADAIAAAAADVSRKAGTKATLTIYVKVPKGVRPDVSTALFKKVDAVNDAIGAPRVAKPRG